MISLSKFRENLFPLFEIMGDTGMEIDVYHKRKPYKVMVVPTHEPVRIMRKPRIPNSIKPEEIQLDECPGCNDMRVNGVCMNRECTYKAG